MMRESLEEADRWHLEPKPASLWWTDTDAQENKGGHDDQGKKGLKKASNSLGFCSIQFANRRPTQHGGCKYNTSNDVFSRCKSVHKMATGESDDQLIQYDNKLELETSYKMKLGPKVEN